MNQVKLFKENWEVEQRLSLFSATKDELILIIEAAVTAKADSVPHDPNSAPGLLSWIYGTRALRDVFVAKGWIADSDKNVPSVYDPITGTRIIFQNTDSACAACHPRPISCKGVASEELIYRYLFEDMEEQRQKKINGKVWFLCVSTNSDCDDVQGELSLPIGIEAGQFSGFIERIFIVKPGEWPPSTPTKKINNIDNQDFEILVTRKK